MVRGDELVIRPIKTVAGGEFAEQILSDLIKEGLSGEELLTEFNIIYNKNSPTSSGSEMNCRFEHKCS